MNNQTQITVNLTDEIRAGYQRVVELNQDLWSRGRFYAKACIDLGKLLSTKKESLHHGQWLPWFEEHREYIGGFSARSATDFMRVAKQFPDYDPNQQTSADLKTFTAILRLCSGDSSDEQQESDNQPHRPRPVYLSHINGLVQWYGKLTRSHAIDRWTLEDYEQAIKETDEVVRVNKELKERREVLLKG